MNKIKILSESVSNAIAAGEVVENPASMVKELLENSLDSGSNNIIIEVDDGGLNVSITDDGIGMNKEDLLLSIERHSTSKIETKEDLFNINTYGFRGEALSSIVSVSRATLTSRSEDDEIGNRIVVTGGKIIDLKEVSRGRGTTIEIRDLFFNTPARLKFLRKDSTEYMNIKDIVIREALANSEVKITLIIDGKEIIKTSGNGIENTIVEIFGVDALKNLTKFSVGFLGNSNLFRSNRDSIFTYVNGRPVKSKIIETAILDGYYTKLMKGKYPFAIVFIDIKPNEVDVNVHPSKKIVKFSNQSTIYDLVKNEIDKIFNRNEEFSSPLINFKNNEKESEDLNKKTLEMSDFNFTPIKTEKIRLENIEHEVRDNEFRPYVTEKEKQENYSEDHNYNSEENSKDMFEKEDFQERKNENFNEINRENFEEKSIYNKEPIQNKQEKIEIPFRIIGQIFDTFILVERNGVFEIYDQHIIHERILYEELKEEYYKKSINSQQLLVPIKITLDPRDKEIVLENMDSFNFFGFELDEFDNNEIVVRAVPVVNFKDSVENIIRFIITNIKDNKDEDIRESMIISMSCKGAIKANQKLDMNDIYPMIKKLHEIGKYTCPHGRPIIAKITLDDLEKLFKRK